MVALSNMPAVKTEEHGNGTKTVEFAETPIMSAYLIAFCVGHFECIETKSKAVLSSASSSPTFSSIAIFDVHLCWIVRKSESFCQKSELSKFLFPWGYELDCIPD